MEARDASSSRSRLSLARAGRSLLQPAFVLARIPFARPSA